MKTLEEWRRRPALLLEPAFAILLIAWRFAAPTWHPVWQDAPLYLGLYWLFLIVFPDAKRGVDVTLALMLLLLVLYVKAQMPHMLLMVDLLP